MGSITKNILQEGISLFFPAYNEEANVGGTIEKSLTVLQPLGCQYEIIIVDDGSRDRTADIVREYAAKNPNVILERHEKKPGLRRSVADWLSKMQQRVDFLFRL